VLYDELDDEARLQRPGAIERFTYETLASIAGPALVRGLDHIVPVEAVADSDEQVFAARPPRSAGLVVRPEAHVVSLDALADHPSVTSVVTSTDVRARRPLPSVSELLLVGISRNPLPDAETQANLPSLDSLFASWAWGDRNLELSRHQAGSMRRMAIPRGLLPVDRGIGALTDFVALEELKLKNCLPAESLSPLAELTELRSLVADAGGGWLTLAACTRLEDVAAFRPRLKDLRGLRAWKRLRSLVISMGPLRTIAGIEAFERLESLRLSALKIDDLAPLTGLEALSVLDLAYLPRVTDIGPLASLPSLRRLLVDGKPASPARARIASLRPLGHAEHLEELCLRYVAVEDGDLSPLIGLPSLRKVQVPADLADAADALQSARPDVRVWHPQPWHRVPQPSVGAITINPPTDRTKKWTIYQDLTDLLAVEDNYQAERLLWRGLAGRGDGLLDRIKFDSESNAVGVLADTQEDIRTVAMAINDIAASFRAVEGD
jgi:hypothetical protein